MPYFDFDQQRLFYREQGTGQVLLMLHGNTASSACHQGDLDYYQSRYRAVALDALGCGQSARVAVWSTEWWRGYAEQAAALIRHLDGRPAMVMGTSGGAIAALWLAALHPNLVRAVIADSLVRVEYPQNLRNEVLINRAERNAAQVGFWHWAHGEDWAQVVEADNQLLLGLAERGGDLLAGCPLDQITCPVLITVSRKDDLLPEVPAQTIALAAHLPTCRVYLHHEGGHPLMWSQAAVFRGVVEGFLAEIN